MHSRVEDMTVNYQFNARHITNDDDGSTIAIGFADDEFSPSRFVLIQKSLNADERDRVMGFDKIHIQIEDESRSGYGGIIEVSMGHDRLTVFLDQAARAALKIDGDIEILVDRIIPDITRPTDQVRRGQFRYRTRARLRCGQRTIGDETGSMNAPVTYPESLRHPHAGRIA